MQKHSYAVLLFMFAAAAAQGLGACHAVGPSAAGNGSGANWTNRMNKLPSKLVRGDSYYLMDGGYGNYSFTTANSGATRITVKKAQTYDFGRTSDGCPNDISAGWQAATMGSGQAQFTSISASGGLSYITLDGNGKASAKGCGTSPATNAAASDCGLKFTVPVGSISALSIGAWDNGANRSNNWTIRYIEVQGGGDANNTNPNVSEEDMYCHGGCDNLLVDHVWLHDSGCDFIKLPWSASASFQNSYFKQNASSAACHGQLLLSEVSLNNVTFTDNIMSEIQGTAVWSFVTGAQINNFLVYNNVLFRPQGSTAAGTSNGIFACINAGAKCTNVKFIGNSIINYTADYQGALGIRDENGGGSYIWENNIFYDITPTDRVGFLLGSGTTFTEDHNSWLNSGSPRKGTADVTVTSGAPNPFVNWPGNDFRLANQNAYWESGAVLPAPFNIDMAGNQRPGTDGVWDRGAFEYAGAQTPAPPTGLTSMVH